MVCLLRPTVRCVCLRRELVTRESLSLPSLSASSVTALPFHQACDSTLCVVQLRLCVRRRVHLLTLRLHGSSLSPRYRERRVCVCVCVCVCVHGSLQQAVGCSRDTRTPLPRRYGLPLVNRGGVNCWGRSSARHCRPLLRQGTKLLSSEYAVQCLARYTANGSTEFP